MVLRWVWSGCSTSRKECLRKPSHGAQPGHSCRKGNTWQQSPGKQELGEGHQRGLGQWGAGTAGSVNPQSCVSSKGTLLTHWICSFLPRKMPIPESNGISSFWDSARKLEFNFLPTSNTKGMLRNNRKRSMGSQLTATRRALPFAMFSCSPYPSTLSQRLSWLLPLAQPEGLSSQLTCPAPRHSPQRNSHLRLLRSSDMPIWQKFQIKRRDFECCMDSCYLLWKWIIVLSCLWGKT